MSDARVLIVGAGPTGLVLALFLTKHGIPVRLIDKAAGPGTASRAVAVQSRTLELYNQLGIADAIVAAGIKIETATFRLDSHDIAHVTLGEIGRGLSPFPFVLAYPQDDHERFLIAQLRAAGVEVEWNTALHGFTQDSSGVRAVIETSDRAETIEIAYLCGCDGAHSRVRETLNVAFQGGTYAHIYYVADVALRGAAQPGITVNLGPQSFLLRLPVRSSGMERLIGIAPVATEAKSTLTFDDVRGEAERLLGVEVAAVNWFSTYKVHHRVAEHFQVGRCFLAGDAGHLHSPVGGQGMNTGIGDAINLAWKLAHVLHARADATLLDTYETERIAFARALVSTTDRAFQFIVANGAAGELMRRSVLPRLISLITKFATGRRAIFRIISQIRVNYEKGPLSDGYAGRIKGGDRLPWVVTGETDNFMPLRSCDWQVHVYGTLAPSFAETAKSLGVPVRQFAWSAAAMAAGLAENAAYLIRPDGYVALAMVRQKPEELHRFATRFALEFAPL